MVLYCVYSIPHSLVNLSIRDANVHDTTTMNKDPLPSLYNNNHSLNIQYNNNKPRGGDY